MTDSAQKQAPLPPVPDSEDIVYTTTDDEHATKAPEGVQVRIPGLDMARGFSMLVVVLGHGIVAFFGGSDWYSPRITAALWVMLHSGVELFFVLSGYLIGGILLRDVVPEPSPKAVKVFLARRWLRTLPVYFAVLALEMLWYKSLHGVWEPRWEYVLFVQNFFSGAEYFMPASWSLAVEQWSYLFLPLLMLPLTGFVAKRWELPYSRALVVTTIAAITLLMIARMGLALFLSSDQLDVSLRKAIPLRLDALLYGMLIIHCKMVNPELYKRLSSLSVFLSSLIALGLFMVLQYNDGLLERLPEPMPRFLFHAGIGFVITDILVALLLPFLDINPRCRDMARLPRVRRLLEFAAKYSYAVYLVHLSVIYAIVNRMPMHISGYPVIEFCWLALLLGLAVGISFSLAWILYYIVEKPGMSLRRFIPK